MSNINDRIKIIKEELKCKNYKELSELMGVKESRIKTLASNKSASSFSEEEIRTLVKKFNFNMYWIVLGQGDIYEESKKEKVNIHANGNNNNIVNGNMNGNVNINTSEFNHGADIKEIITLLQYAPSEFLNIIKERLKKFKELTHL